MGMSRAAAEQNWKRLVSENQLTKSEEETIHRHLARSYSLEKDHMSYEELKNAAREVVSRIRY